jgi:transmembrane sensor
MNIDNNIIERVLNDKATSEEARMVAKWFSTSYGQKHLSSMMDEEWAKLNSQAETMLDADSTPISDENLYNRCIEKIEHRRTISRKRRLLVAAIVIPLVILTATTYFFADKAGAFSSPEYSEVSVQRGQKMFVGLPDGSTVMLNSQSSLIYPKRFGLFSRKVKLSGEGWFWVAKESNRPFSVDLNGVEVKVTGTKFDVCSYSDDRNVKVALEEGCVQFTRGGDILYTMAVGDELIYDRQTGQHKVYHPKTLNATMAWRSNALSFYLTPLQDILKTLSRQYDVDFIVKDARMLKSRFTLSTSKTNISDVLHELEMVSYIDFISKGDNTYEVTFK